MHFVYIHGFNSGPESRSGASIEALIEKPVFRVRNDYSKGFWQVVASIETQIDEAYPNGQLCLFGTSLGGFYALQLRNSRIKHVIAWNPVVSPVFQLARFVGENTRFTDGQKWQFSRAAQLSYAAAPDPKLWDNEMWDAMTSAYGGATPARQIFLGKQDDLLDPEITEAYWNGHANITWIDSGHRIDSFEDLRAISAIFNQGS